MRIRARFATLLLAFTLIVVPALERRLVFQLARQLVAEAVPDARRAHDVVTQQQAGRVLGAIREVLDGQAPALPLPPPHRRDHRDLGDPGGHTRPVLDVMPHYQ